MPAGWPRPSRRRGTTGIASAQPAGRPRADSRSNSALRSGLAAAQAAKPCSHSACSALPRSATSPGAADRLFLGGEVHGRVEAQDLLGGRDLLLAERGAVRGAGVLLVGRRPADDRAQRDERRLVGDRLGGLEGVVQVLHVLVVAVGGAPAQPLHVPAVGLVPGCDVLGLGDVRVVLDRDEVVVVEHDQVAQFLVPGQRGDLVADALLDVPVGGEGVDEVVERRGARRRVGVVEAALAAGRHRHAHRVADALAERARRGLDARGQAVLRMAGGEAAPRAVPPRGRRA